MEDRKVTITVQINASEVAESRALITGQEMFPLHVFQTVEAMFACMQGNTRADGERLGDLMSELNAAAQGMRIAQLRLREIFAETMISDPDGREGRLQ